MGHTFTNLLIHVIFSTKQRYPWISETWRARLHAYMAGIARNEFGRALVVGGVADHVHGLISIGTALSLGEIMSKWKSLSSGWVHREIEGAIDFAWQTGYAAFSVSESAAPAVRRYIERQAEHHRKQTFEDEYVAFLKRNRIEFDPTAIWD